MTQVSYPGNGSVRAGAALAEKEQIKRKNILMRSYRIPTRFNVPESQNSDVERSIQIMLALVPLDSSGDVHPTAQAILICDHNRLSKFTIIDLHDHSEQEHFHPGSKVRFLSKIREVFDLPKALAFDMGSFKESR